MGERKVSYFIGSYLSDEYLTFKKPPKLRSIIISQITEAAKMGRLKTENNPDCRLAHTEHGNEEYREAYKTLGGTTK